MDRPLDIRDLEISMHDVADMAALLHTLAQDALEDRSVTSMPGYVPLTCQQADSLLFASRLMLREAQAARSRWNEIHDARTQPARMVGGDRNG